MSKDGLSYEIWIGRKKLVISAREAHELAIQLHNLLGDGRPVKVLEKQPQSLVAVRGPTGPFLVSSK